jgi:hypothetical protein
VRGRDRWGGWPGLFLGAVVVLLSAVACGGSKSSPTSSSDSADVLLFELNATDNDGRTRRFANLPIAVFLNGVADEGELTAWTGASGGAVTFTFVGSDPGTGISLRLQDDIDDRTCGFTTWRRGNNTIQKAEIAVNPRLYRGSRCKRTPTHEAGHAIGIFGHTSDGGLMDPDGGNGDITASVGEMIRKLYTQAPGTPVFTERARSTQLRRYPVGSVGIIFDPAR